MNDGTALTMLLDPLPRTEALRDALNLPASRLDRLLAIVSAEFVAKLIESLGADRDGKPVHILLTCRDPDIENPKSSPAFPINSRVPTFNGRSAS